MREQLIFHVPSFSREKCYHTQWMLLTLLNYYYTREANKHYHDTLVWMSHSHRFTQIGANFNPFLKRRHSIV